jgi:Uncharacterized protein conserved in bacteria (DUF2330)
MKRLILSFLLLSLPVLADPCGMVPPISLEGGDANIERIGEQITYVFYKNGMETVVIHPGFQGNVDEFGMLVPFPQVPALRKVPEQTFAQLENALDPPLITYWLHDYRMDDSELAEPGLMLRSEAAPVDRDEVVVLKEEAVGMYEIAVLEAGSATALKRWMDQHGYRFPDGMEPTCGDYIKDKWCFVAVKTRVGSKKAVDPRPGMRVANPSKPKDSVFTGKVQAMGFRFHSKELVVPMRLSTFNGGDLNNTLYVLAEQPLRVSNLPTELVKRQLTGEKLYANLTQPLPYRIEGGSTDDMSPNDWKQLESRRDPVPYSGVAAELFASDLLANDLGTLSHSYEEREKSLLDIGERLGLRGGQMDALHASELTTDREEVKSQALAQLKGMTLTLIQGEFPRDVLAKENLRFKPYRLDTLEDLAATPSGPSHQTTSRGDKAMLILPFGLILGVIFGLSRSRQLTVALLGLVMLGSPQVRAQEPSDTSTDWIWINMLDVPEKRVEAVKALEKRGRAAYPYLIGRYKNEEAPVTERGYCLALLTKSPDSNVSKVVHDVVNETNSPLVKLWSEAALVQLTESPKELLVLLDAEYAKTHGDPDKVSQVIPVSAELQRPIALKLKEWGPQLTLEDQLRFLGLAQNSGQPSNVSPNIAAVITPALKAAKIPDLVRLMFHSDGQDVRRLSAALLAGFQEEKRKAVFSSVMEELSVNSSATDVPWAGGALFLPQFSNMNKSEAQELITGLTRWSLWTDIHKTPAAQIQPLENNLRSYSLWAAAGGGEDWRNANGGKEWLQAYGKLMGADAVASLLQEQKVPKNSPYWAVVKVLK